MTFGKEKVAARAFDDQVRGIQHQAFHRVVIGPFATGQYLLEAIQTEIARRGKFTLEEDRGEAQLTLEGTILSLEKRPVAFSSSDEALQYQTYVTVSAVLRDTRNNKAVWRIAALREGDSYGATSTTVVTDSPDFPTGSTLNSKDIAQLSDVQLSESQEREALDRVFQNTSRDLYNAMVDHPLEVK